MHDRFVLRGPFGAPYEFLWANPYLPGLSFYHMPLFFHDQRRGELYARSTWDDDARWIGYRRGRAQVFQNGKRYTMDATSAQSRELDLGDLSIIAGSRIVVIPKAGHYAIFERPDEVGREIRKFLDSMPPW